MSVNLVIKMIQAGGEFPVESDLASTIAELKDLIAGRAELPSDNIRLVCAGRIWQDNATVGSYEPRAGSIVHCLNNPPRATAPATQQTLQAVNPMQSMLGGGALQPAAAAGNDPFAQMMAQSQQMMQQNPDMMQQMMNSPMVQQMMSNPETMRGIMRMNPQLNQLMEQRPEIARMLEDPEMLQQSMQMMRNPSLMREMQRNADRTIGHLDVMPGGHAALARAHEDMVDPLMTAFSNQDGSAGGVMNTYGDPADSAPNNEALPNPWGAPVAASTPAATPAATSVPMQGPAFPMFGAQSGTAPAPGADPMAGMMQQMMNNPAMMQQSMQMMQQMFGGQQGDGMGAPPLSGISAGTPALPVAASTPSATLAPTSVPMQGPAFPMSGAHPSTAPAPGFDPMAGMMQQMMNNPAMMQQSMQMMQQMFGGQQGNAMAVPALPGTTTDTPALPAAAPQADTGANPMATMMQQMMSNPALMQQSMQMAQQMHGGQQGAGFNMFGGQQGAGAGYNPFMFGGPAFAPQQPAFNSAAEHQSQTAPAPAVDGFAQARFAAQLAQLSAMGFCNEAACLRALVQHQGRVDGAIDALLASGE